MRFEYHVSSEAGKHTANLSVSGDDSYTFSYPLNHQCNHLVREFSPLRGANFTANQIKNEGETGAHLTAHLFKKGDKKVRTRVRTNWL